MSLADDLNALTNPEDDTPADPEQPSPQRYQELRAALRRTQAQLERQRDAHAEYVETLYQAVRDGIEAIDVPPAPPVKSKDKRRKDAEVAVPLLSDTQLGKLTPSYNSEVAVERVEAYAHKILEITEVQRSDHPVKEAVVPVLGDVVEGELIFPGQEFLIDSGLYRQATVVGPEMIDRFLRILLTEFERVHVVWVIGNHGAIGGKARRNHDPETNADRMLGQIMRIMYQHEDRVSFQLPDGRGERNWYAVAEIGNYRALCIHGDQIRGHSGFPWYGLGKKVNGWASGAIPEPFDDVFMGHWHQRASIPLNRRYVWVNGSTESYNTYAQENLAAMSDPSQWLLFVHPEKGAVTAAYGVQL